MLGTWRRRRTDVLRAVLTVCSLPTMESALTGSPMAVDQTLTYGVEPASDGESDDTSL